MIFFEKKKWLRQVYVLISIVMQGKYPRMLFIDLWIRKTEEARHCYCYWYCYY